MSNETEPSSAKNRPPAGHSRADGADLIISALDFIRGSISTDVGACRPPNLARQEEILLQWGNDLGLLLDPADLPPKVVRGGQEHELFHDVSSDRYLKVTRNGVFGLSPGIELALVSSAENARRFHLWEASPLEYLERLHLQNLLVPGINTFEGLILQPGGDLAIVTSQPRFDIVPVTTAEIDSWFASQGFVKITDSAYYRVEDNLGVFDAHDKNLVRADEDILIPFDVIPCRPSGGFLAFIEDTMNSGHTLRAVRTVTTQGGLKIDPP